MASMTFDARSFQIDSRRLWLVGGSVHYARTPADQWADRIHAARLAGLNTVFVPVFWNRHEPMPGQFDFTGDNDLRRFVELIGKAGMHCILGIGPFVSSEWDFGGLPAWLTQVKPKKKNDQEIQLRAANQPFLEASSRFITAVAGQVKDLQVTSTGAGGPIAMLQVESRWYCGDDDTARGYLGELNRYAREAGLNVPIVNDRNLWQHVEGEVDGWAGGEDMLAVVRELATVTPDKPRVVSSFPTRRMPCWGDEPQQPDPVALQRSLAEVLSAGGQFVLDPFHGGTSFGFWAGREEYTRDRFFTSSHDHGAPLSESGTAGPTYHHLRRLCSFASAFGKVFANLDPAYRPVLLDPSKLGSQKSSRNTTSFAVTHAQGTQGGVAFIFAPPGETGGEAHLMLPDGSTLPVKLGGQSVAWCLFDVHLTGRCHLDYSTLNALTLVTQGKARTLVVFGPSGSEGVVSVNGSPIDVTVPGGKTPLVAEHEGLTIVCVNEDGADTTYALGDTVYVGVAGVDAQGEPLALPGTKTHFRIGPDGEMKNVSGPARAAGRVSRKSLSDWTYAPVDEHTAGTSPRYAAIDGPAPLTKLGSPYGYGWYRLSLKSNSAKKHKLLLPAAGDRLHAYLDGEPMGVVGVGPGSINEPNADFAISLRKGTHELVFLADNMGRFTSGNDLGERKGIYGPIWEVSPFKAGKAEMVEDTPIEPLAHRSPIFELREGDATYPTRLSWSFVHRKKSPIIMVIDKPPCGAQLVLNEETVEYVDPSGPARFVFDEEKLNRGKNTIQLALIVHAPAGELETEFETLSKAFADSVSFYEGVDDFGGSAGWAFAKWEAPPPSAFQPLGKAERGLPRWYRVDVDAGKNATVPASLDLTGLSKGQVYLNGHHLGRYFVADGSGKAIPGAASMVVPTAWLRPGAENELLIFDEHGFSPEKVRLVLDPTSVPLVHDASE
ncbi:MAG: beta-galactosidase [Planctomycetota bacterium]